MSKSTTKKLLVAYDPSRPEAVSSDFLVPVRDSSGLLFWGLRSKKLTQQGHMVYLGKAITANDVFAKLVDSGRKIENVAQTFKAIERYLEMLQEYRIGNLLTVEAAGEEACGFRLRKVADAPPVKSANLP